MWSCAEVWLRAAVKGCCVALSCRTPKALADVRSKLELLLSILAQVNHSGLSLVKQQGIEQPYIASRVQGRDSSNLSFGSAGTAPHCPGH